MMKTLAFGLSLVVLAAGLLIILDPFVVAVITNYCVNPYGFYVIASIRVVFGSILIAAAPDSRTPKSRGAVGYIMVAAGLLTGWMGLMAMGLARAVVEWWLLQGATMIRLPGVVAVLVGFFIASACAPSRRSDH